MILLILTFVIALACAVAAWKDDNKKSVYKEKENKTYTVKPTFTLKNLKTHDQSRSAFFWFTVIALVFCSIFWGASYKTYLDARAFYSATKEQYSSAITVYKGHATIDVQSIAWTDLKYQGYQNEVASFIKDLREKVTEYNETIVKKKVFKSNILFNWFVVAPDPDMVVIKLLNPSGKLTE